VFLHRDGHEIFQAETRFKKHTYETDLTLDVSLDGRVPTCQGKLEKVGEFVWSGKGQGKILFKSGKIIFDHADCRYL